MIDPEIVRASPVLRELQPPVYFELTRDQQRVLLKYLSRPFYHLPEMVWTSGILSLIDYLMLPTDKLIDYYIIHGKYKWFLERHRLFKEPTFTLFDKDLSRCCSIAAENGNLPVLQWAHQFGCPWDEWTCIHAEEKGHIEVLQWARENGCPG